MTVTRFYQNENCNYVETFDFNILCCRFFNKRLIQSIGNRFQQHALFSNTESSAVRNIIESKCRTVAVMRASKADVTRNGVWYVMVIFVFYSKQTDCVRYKINGLTERWYK